MNERIPRYVLTLIVLHVAFTNVVLARISISTYLADTNDLISWADPNMPYVYPPIMEGTKMTLVLNSDKSGLWRGGTILIGENYWDQGQLFGRDWDDVPGDNESSITELAGSWAQVNDYLGPTTGIEGESLGFTLRGDFAAKAGPWFILDLETYAPGDCVVTMIDTDVHKIEPSFEMLFPLVPTRDFDEDHKVSLTDFAILANHWQTIITEPNDPQKQLDFNSNNIIDSNDLAYFSQFWLAKTRGLINDSNEMDPNQ